MSIELTPEQSEALAAENGGTVEVVDPRTWQSYRLIPEHIFRQLEEGVCDASPWTADEMAALAGAAFGRLDDDDYSEYLWDSAECSPAKSLRLQPSRMVWSGAGRQRPDMESCDE